MRGLITLFWVVFCSAAYAQLDDEPITPIPDVAEFEPELVALGERLFHEPRLSIDGTVSCASCHNLATGGVDRLKVSTGIMGQQGAMNAPTVFNSSLQFRQFWDGRAVTLFDQADGPINNPKEMASNWEHILAFLKKDNYYRPAFNKLFEDGVQVANVKNAIVTYEKTLLTPNSRFDQYLKGQEHVLSQQEKEGYKLFKSYGCVSCHQGVGVGGNMFQKLGVMKDFFVVGEYQPSDLGRYSLTGLERDKHVFKVPSLRNVALTSPYLHNGSAETLTDVVTTMMNYQLGISPPDEDIEAIVTFLRTLTGEYQGVLLE